MTARPSDWSPLAASDPVGGNLENVSTEAQYYTNLAKEISDQAAKLRKIASDGEQIGKTADKLRDVANDTAGKLDQTHGRVAAVGEALTSWIPHLDTAQTDTLAALNAAREAHSRQSANADPPPGTPAPETDSQKTADDQRSTRLDQANSDFAAAQKKFNDAVSTRDDWASKAANHIKDALDDGLEDSWWDSFCEWVSEHVDIIKMIVEILTWVATAIAILALFIPGLNILAMAFLIAVLAGHTLLAATGNGSWTDVLLDVVAIATFHLGSVIGAAGKLARSSALARGATLAKSAKVLEVLDSRASQKALIETATKGFGKFGSMKNFMNFVSVKSGFFDAVSGFKAGWQGSKAATTMLEHGLPEVTKFQSLTNIGKDIAQNAKDFKALTSIDFLKNDAQFMELASKWKSMINIQRGVAGFGQGIDLTNHALTTSVIPGLNHVLPGLPAWEHFKESTTHGIFTGPPLEGGE